MRRTNRFYFAAFINFCLALGWLDCGLAAAETSAVVASPVTYHHIVRRDPNFSMYVVTVDLGDPRVSARVARGGPDPDGDGPWTTTLLPVSEIAARENFDIAINGDFFAAQATKDVEGRNTGYVRGKFATPEGMAMTDGRLWHRAEKPRPYLAIKATRHAALFTGATSEPLMPEVRQIVGGGQIIVMDGKPIEFTSSFATNRHPRTAVGLDRTGARLTLLVVDGRQPQLSIGMTLHELSGEMIRQGCASAINLDGGGSSTLVYRNPASQSLKVVNSPSDSRERSVADVLGITVHAAIPAPD